jgi:hypothetical protein
MNQVVLVTKSSKAPSIKATAYKSLIRPILEYSAAVWDPHTQKNIDKVEMIQWRDGLWTDIITLPVLRICFRDPVQRLSWPILQLRRSEARLCLMYKMVHSYSLVATNIGLYVVPVTRQTRRTHPYSFIQLQPRLKAYRMSFFPKTIVEWNQLPSGSVTAPTVETFRTHLVGLRPTRVLAFLN